MKENVRKFEKTLREDEELRAKFAAEFKRIAEEKSAEIQKLDPEEMGKAAGGRDDGKHDDADWCIEMYACYTLNNHDTPDREGYPCLADYDCITIYHH